MSKVAVLRSSFKVAKNSISAHGMQFDEGISEGMQSMYENCKYAENVQHFCMFVDLQQK